MSAKTREMWRVLARLNEDPDWWPEQLDKIREGATIEVLAAVVSVYYSVYRNWVRGDAERESALADAEREGKARRLEKILQATYETATAEVTEAVKHSDKLRAAEILLRPQTHLTISADAPGNLNMAVSFVKAEDGKPVP